MYTGLNNLGLNGAGNKFSPSKLFSALQAGLWAETYDPTALVVRRNQLSWTQDLDKLGTTWSAQTGTTVTANVVAAPDGSMTADKVDLTSTAVGAGIYQAGILGMSAQNVKSVYIRADVAGGTIQLSDPNATSATGTYTLDTAWQRFSLVDNFGGQSNAAGIWIRKTGSTPNIIYVWGAQLESGTTATAYQRISDWTTEYLEALGSGARRNLAIATDGPTAYNLAPWNITGPNFAFTITPNALPCGNGGPAYLTRIEQTGPNAAATPYIAGVCASTTFTLSIYVAGSPTDPVLTLLARNGTTSTSILSGTIDTTTGNTSAGYTSIAIAPGIWRVFTTVSSGFSIGDQIQFYFGATGAQPIATAWYVGGMQYELGSVLTAYQSVPQAGWGNSHVTSLAVSGFQDSLGATPAIVVGGTVSAPLGELHDKRGAYGPDLVSAGTTAIIGTATAAFYDTTYGVGSVTRVDSVNQSSVEFPNLVINGTYRLVITNLGPIALLVRNGGSGGVVLQTIAVGTSACVDVVLTGGAGDISLASSNVGTATFVVSSLRLLTGLPSLAQATSTARPILGAKVNLLSETETLDGASWTKTSVTVAADTTTASDGTPTADTITSTINGLATLNKNVTLLPTTPYTSSAEFKAGNVGTVDFGIWDTGWVSFWRLDLSTGAVTTQGGTGSAVAVNKGNGWWRITISFISTAATTYTVYTYPRGGGVSQIGDFIYASKYDVRLTDDTTKGYPVYQRVGTAATDYNSVGFPWKATFDGVDDALATGTFPSSTLSANADLFVLMRRTSAAKGIVFSTLSSTTPTLWLGAYDPADAAGSSVNLTAGTPIPLVNGVSVGANDRASLSNALAPGAWKLLEFNNADMSGFLVAGLSTFGTGWFCGMEVAAVVVCPAQTNGVRAQIRSYLGQKVGLSL